MTVTSAGLDEATVLRNSLQLVRIDSPSGHEAALSDALEPDLRRLESEARRDATFIATRRPSAVWTQSSMSWLMLHTSRR